MSKFFDMITRHIAWSRPTFGPGDRTKGIIKHIRKELEEIEAEPLAIDRAEEFVDVFILGLDGIWRNLAAHAPHWTHDDIAREIVGMVAQKRNKIERREWPDWRTASEDEPIEHVRGIHD